MKCPAGSFLAFLAISPFGSPGPRHPPLRGIETAPSLEGQCGKLFKTNAGEVAERLKAAVC